MSGVTIQDLTNAIKSLQQVNNVQITPPIEVKQNDFIFQIIPDLTLLNVTLDISKSRLNIIGENNTNKIQCILNFKVNQTKNNINFIKIT